MEPHQNISAKKQRNAKIQRDRQRRTVPKIDSDKPTGSPDIEPVLNSASQPQPQRPTRRQRNEPTVNNTAAAEEPTKVVPQEVKETPVIDHSNLKRETEEISKLTKKFTKREITSNWHRYATSESDPQTEQVEEEGPADFSVLLKVPVSRGGHLQLKEEQRWSSATPGGHWTLDLRRLSFSLACIPTHERLRLPEDKLSEEEIKRYVYLAEEARKYYNADESAELKDDVGYREKPFNILDVERSTNTLLNMDMELDKSSDNISINNFVPLKRRDSNESNEVKWNVEEIKIHEKSRELPTNNNLLKTEASDSNKINSSDLLLTKDRNNAESPLQDKLENQITYKQFPVDKHLSHNEINLTKNQGCSQVELSESARENISNKISEPNTEDITNYEIKEKRPQRAKKRHSPMKEEIENKTLDKVKDITLEDDEDLDFLLSLKKPTSSLKESEPKPAVLKDSSFLPGGTEGSSATTQDRHSDLDDWLDSVLED